VDMTKHTVNAQGVSALKRLYALEQQRAAITSETTLEVLRARKGGASWAMIASSLGVTSQAAWERYTERNAAAGLENLIPLPGFELQLAQTEEVSDGSDDEGTSLDDEEARTHHPVDVDVQGNRL